VFPPCSTRCGNETKPIAESSRDRICRSIPADPGLPLSSALKPAFSTRSACARAGQPGEHFSGGATPSGHPNSCSPRHKFGQPPSIYYVVKNPTRSGSRSHLLFAPAPIHRGWMGHGNGRCAAQLPTEYRSWRRCLASSVLPFPIPDGEVLDALRQAVCTQMMKSTD